MSEVIKPSQLTRIGYEYQDLCGLELLIDWLDNPDLFEWVKFDSTDLDGKKVNGLDDITALRSDGLYLLRQVKFTIDPERDDLTLTFDWLTQPSGQKKTGQSLLEKWSTAFFSVPLELIGEAKLQTNRRPYASFDKCLKDGFLELETLEEELQTHLVKQIGSREKAEVFFQKFEFEHSLQSVNNFEASLQDRICRNHTNEFGWYKLIREVLKWSGFKNSPDSEGKIQLQHLKELLEHKLARPMPQEFSIPKGYCPPTKDFHEKITKLCVSSVEPNLSVIWGTPGRGKSTYLSYLKNDLQEHGVHVIRHHFFLSLTDETVGRWLFHKVASTFLHQICREFPSINLPSSEGDMDGKLRRALLDAAQLAAESEKPLVVILDGLDHVWRESGEIIALTTLFDELIPLPDNVNLIIGTQKISDDQLPKKLLEERPKDDWIEIPTLDSPALFSWLKCQLNIAGHSGATSDEQCEILAGALMTKSSGLPLYLTYALAQLLADFGEFDENDINALPDCPDGDINKYYARLWNDLPQEAKDILHLVSVSGFIWPNEICLAKCLTEEALYLGAFLKVEHFFDRRPIGLKPFHGSILVYASNDSQHQIRVKYVLPLLLEWLRKEAPDHIKWGWEWITDAKLGNANSLIYGPSREWLSQSIANGFSPYQSENILSDAEYRAYKDGEYARAVELRTMKTRFVNAEYQGAEYEQLLMLALVVRKDDQSLKHFLDDLDALTETELLSASRIGHQIDPNLPNECLDEVNRRIELRQKYGVGADSRDNISPNLIAKLAALSKTASIKRLFSFAAQFDYQASIIESYCQEAIRFGNGSKCAHLFELLAGAESSEKIDLQSQRKIAEYALRTKLINGIHIANVEEYEPFFDSPFIACRFSCRGENSCNPPELKAIIIEKYAHSISHDYFYNHFFCSLWAAINQEGDYDSIPRQIAAEKYAEPLQIIFYALDECARQATLALQQGEVLDPVYLYVLVNEILSKKESPTSSETEVHISFINALPCIAFDLALISQWEPGQDLLNRDKLVELCNNSWWHWERWAEFVVDLGLQSVTKDGAKYIIESAKASVLSDIHTISDLADGFCKIALWAYHNALHTECRNLIAQSFLYFTGYGNRKDVTMHDVLEVLGACHEKDIDILRWLKRIEHIALNILVFTDGKETRHCPRMYFDLLGEVSPFRLFTLYEYEQQDSNWHNCDHILKVIATVGDLADINTVALLETASQPDVRIEVKQRADSGEQGAQKLYAQLVHIWGKPVAEKEACSTPHYYVDPSIEVSEYPPNNLKGLLEAVSNLDTAELPEHHYFGAELAIIRWCKYWAEQGQLKSILDTIEERLSSSKGCYHVERALDELTKLVREHFGRSEAFKWLCLSHRLNHGWSRYFSSGSVDRIVKAATDYPLQWQEFLQVTSEPKDEYWGGKYGLQIGSSLLARFFLELGNHAKAVEIVEMMVSQVEYDVNGIELKTISWD